MNEVKDVRDLLEIENGISQSMQAHYNYLIETGEQIKSYIQANKDKVIENRLLSKAIVTRMFYAFRDSREYSNKINRVKKPPIPDYFTETIGVYTSAFLSDVEGVTVVMEQQFQDTKLRPDIQILKNGRVVFVLEMKIDLGRNRYNWKSDYYKKVNDYGLTKDKVCLVVLSSSNWSRFPEDKQNNWVSLSKRHPNDSNHFRLYKDGEKLTFADFDDFLEPLLQNIESQLRAVNK